MSSPGLWPASRSAVTLALPQDIAAHAYDYPAHFFAKRVWRIERRAPDARRIEEAAALLRSAKRPAVIAGGGVHYSQAWDELQSFVETFGIAVGETLSGKGAIRRPSPQLVGGPEASQKGLGHSIRPAKRVVRSAIAEFLLQHAFLRLLRPPPLGHR